MAAYTESRSWSIQGPIGSQGIMTTDTVQNHPLGRTCLATDATYGEGQFIYLLGCALTTTGLLVAYNTTTYQTTLLTATGWKNKGTPVAVAMSANVAAQYGWYQIRGNAIIKKTAVAVAPGIAMYSSATDGRIKVIASAGQQIVGLTTANITGATVVTSTSVVVCTINVPHTQGQVT